MSLNRFIIINGLVLDTSVSRRGGRLPLLGNYRRGTLDFSFHSFFCLRWGLCGGVGNGSAITQSRPPGSDDHLVKTILDEGGKDGGRGRGVASGERKDQNGTEFELRF